MRGYDHGYVHWNELLTRDAAGAAEFYAKVLGWEIMEVDMGGPHPYRVAKVGEDMVAGIMQMHGPEFEGMPERWVPYMAVDDADKAAADARAAGAKVVNEPFDVPGVGRIVMIHDNVDAVLGLMKPANPE